MIQWVKWPQKWTVYLQETHLHVSCGKKRLLRCSVVSCLRNSCFPTAAWPFRKPRSELRLGFFEANTCKLTYSSAYDGVSEKCRKKHLQGVQEAFVCLSTVPACEDEPRFDNSSVNWGRRKVTWSKNTQTPSILVGGDSLILCLYWQPAQEGSGGGRRKQTFFIFLSRTPRFLLRARSRALVSLADVFKKNEKKNKTTSVYRLAWQEFEREGKGNYSHFFPQTESLFTG